MLCYFINQPMVADELELVEGKVVCNICRSNLTLFLNHSNRPSP